MRGAAGLLLAMTACPGCAPREVAAEQPVAPSAPERPPLIAPDASSFAQVIASPQPEAQAEGLAARLMDLCDRSDAALAEVASRLGERLLTGASIPDTAEIAFEIRAAGAPYVWPRAWSLSGGVIDDEDATRRARAWLDAIPRYGQRRCGAARVHADTDAAVLLLSDVVADVAPLSSRARTGQWLTFDAKLLVPATAAKLVLLGPRGAPKPVPTQLDQNSARARFAASEPGPWLVQLLADVSVGPRPVAEAMFFADVPPPQGYEPHPAPGESQRTDEPEVGLLDMVNAARVSEHLAPLARSPALDAIARAHAEAMKARGVLGHDVGQGGASERLAAAGLSFSGFGENIARAQSAARAHRVIWASPSHRGNVIEPRFAQLGVGVARDGGTLWVCELFATRQ